ncbi:hypothetical protein KY285_026195 [Solanum tuberosum]|nr:hypothetical protein KY285_026195 [Solanum tuberosum]
MEDRAGQDSMEQWPPLPTKKVTINTIGTTQKEANGNKESQGEIRSSQGSGIEDLKEVEPKKKWVNFFNSNRLSAKGMNLSYITPVMKNGEKVIELKKEEIDKATEEWKQALILYVVGESPTIAAMERNEVLYSGPHMLNNRPIIVKVWSPEFDFNKEVLQTVPICQYPNLPLSCWSMDSLSRISSGLGEPLYADECTTKVDRISFARVLIEMDVTRELPRKLKVEEPNGRVFEQEVQYEWVSEYCAKCMQVGLSWKEVGKVQARKITKWQPKMTASTIGEAKVPKIKEQVAAPRGETWKQTPSKAAGKSTSKPQDMQMMMQNRFDTIHVYDQGSTSLGGCQHMHNEGEGDGMNIRVHTASHLNIRGLNKPYKQEELKLFMRENNVSIIAILEHKIKEGLANKIFQKVAPGWRYEGNYAYTTKGRIWILWDPKYMDCVVGSKTAQYIQTNIKVKGSGIAFVFVAIYGLHTIHDRLGLWEDIRGLVATTQGPVLSMGDYNAILRAEDRPQGSQVQDIEVKDFNEFLSDTGMHELKIVGGTYTWSNGHTCSRIDRALVNAD